MRDKGKSLNQDLQDEQDKGKGERQKPSESRIKQMTQKDADERRKATAKTKIKTLMTAR